MPFPGTAAPCRKPLSPMPIAGQSFSWRGCVASLLKPFARSSASSKWMNMPSPNCSIAGNQSASREIGAPRTRKLNILNIAISRRRRSFKSRESVEARHLSQTMHRDDVLDHREVDLGGRGHPRRRAAAFARRASRSDGSVRFQAARLRTYRTRTSLASGWRLPSHPRESAAAGRRFRHPDRCRATPHLWIEPLRLRHILRPFGRSPTPPTAHRPARVSSSSSVGSEITV